MSEIAKSSMRSTSNVAYLRRDPERDAFVSGLFEQFHGPLRRFLRRLLPTDADSEDVAQESYLKLYRLSRPAMVRNPRALLFKTATNIALDRLAGMSRASETFVEDWDLDGLPSRLPTPDRSVASEEALASLQRVLEELPPRRRQVIVMHKLMQMTHREIAEELGITRSMVEQHMTRALLHCRRRWAEIDPSVAQDEE